MRPWIETNLDRLYGYAFSLTQESNRARELVQEGVLDVLEAARRPADAAAWRAWMFRIPHNVFIDKTCKSGREICLEGVDQVASDAESCWAGDRRIVHVISVRLAVAKLPLAHRGIIVLVDFAGCS